jgi:hypothetical protein
MLIIRPTDVAIKARDYESVNIPDIPTNAEIEFNCLDGSNELAIQLKNEGNDIHVSSSESRRFATSVLT